MRFIEREDQIPNNKSETLFDKRGEKVLSEKEKVFAKVLSKGGGKPTYFVLTYENNPFDPWGMYKNKSNDIKTNMKSVSKGTFDFYMLFLKTRNSLYLTRANRSFIND
tara:strand:- start:15026 stop:15349 length:324 start_codon:yes stop_codon:yes gene_type:complete